MTEVYLSFLIKISMALVMGAIVGIEREIKQKPAGLKTHVLICVGAAAITFLSEHFAFNGDPGRIAAQIVSGIGFIGGGAILQSKKYVHGLTTAATMWIAATIGMLCGAGYFVPAMIVTGVDLMFILTSQFYLRTKFSRTTYSMTIEIEKLNALEVIEDMVHKFDLNVEYKSLVRTDAIHLHLNYATTPLNQHLFTRRLFALKGIGEVIKV